MKPKKLLCTILFYGICIHNYYHYATMIAMDCEQIHWAVSTVMKNRLYGRLTKKGQINEVYDPQELR